MSFYTYTGDRPNVMPPFEKDERINDPSLYRPAAALKNAVNVAIHLGSPLLLTGEPGTGKTQLAYNVAWNLGLDTPLVFNTRTTSAATDLFYKYDAIGHFQYGQNRGGAILTEEEIEKRFIRYHALGEAIRSNKRRVVLIDEIDKAPRDLPNDILNILEDLSFDVPEIGKTYAAEAASRPIIILTSNSEKNLPDAFLRRCVFFHIEFPAEQQLFDILSARFAGRDFDAEALKQTIIPHFMEVRNLLQRKKPGTAELIYWVSVLGKASIDIQKLAHYRSLPEENKRQLLMTYHVLAKNEQDLKLLKGALGL